MTAVTTITRYHKPWLRWSARYRGMLGLLRNFCVKIGLLTPVWP